MIKGFSSKKIPYNHIKSKQIYNFFVRNHDYRDVNSDVLANASAQIEYTYVSKRW